MDYIELNEKYKNVPKELKNLKRWVCFKIEERDGKLGKFPMNAIDGKNARVNDDITWSYFNTALIGCIKYKFDGIGFVLGGGIFGVDLDNHPDKTTGELEMTPAEFDEIANEFINVLDSYSERSVSGNGVHIICSGKLPGAKKKTKCVEIYDSGRFFAFTGDVINPKLVEERTKEIIPLYEKYMPKEKTKTKEKTKQTSQVFSLTDQNRILDKAMNNPKNGELFKALWFGDVDGAYAISNGTWFDDSHSSADLAFCNLLAFWFRGDETTMDSVFRQSGLMREKWDRMTGDKTYGQMTLENAIDNCTSYYEPAGLAKKNTTKKYTEDPETGEIIEKNSMSIDENGEPIFDIPEIFKRYPCNDTGNAERFYDYFGHLFKYNKTDKIFMFWTGKTWIRDEKDIIRKYANKLIQVAKSQVQKLQIDIIKRKNEGEDTSIDEEYVKAATKNLDRISNKAGKDAMLFEFQSLYDVAVTSDEFNKDDFLLNTDSGIVDLRTGVISDYDPKLMMSKNTNVKVSYEEPTVWLNFLNGIFERGNPRETEEIIDCIQKCLGYSLSGSTKEQCMFLMYGSGSNGKSTFTELVSHIMGSYADNVNSEILMQQKIQQNNSFTIAKLKDARFVETGETDSGARLAEGTVKHLTGDSKLSAAFKYANEFSFTPKFKIWFSTNNKPVITGTDHGIWRRIFLFPFLHIFTEEEKDKDLPEKLRAEADRILGWCIKGFQKYYPNKRIPRPQCLEDEVKEYKEQMDVVAQFISSECYRDPGFSTTCKSLYKSYKLWCIDMNAFVLTERKFSEELKAKGFKIQYRDANGKLSNSGVRYYLGIRCDFIC